MNSPRQEEASVVEGLLPRVQGCGEGSCPKAFLASTGRLGLGCQGLDARESTVGAGTWLVTAPFPESRHMTLQSIHALSLQSCSHFHPQDPCRHTLVCTHMHVGTLMNNNCWALTMCWPLFFKCFLFMDSFQSFPQPCEYRYCYFSHLAGIKIEAQRG